MTDKDIKEILERAKDKSLVDMSYEERLVARRQMLLDDIEDGPMPLDDFLSEIDSQAITSFEIRKEKNEAKIAEIEKEIGYVPDVKQPSSAGPSI